MECLDETIILRSMFGGRVLFDFGHKRAELGLVSECAANIARRTIEIARHDEIILWWCKLYVDLIYRNSRIIDYFRSVKQIEEG
jgi:hypothetical protein